MKPADLVNKLLSEGKLPPVAELFRIFSQINVDCLKSGESVVDFTDIGYYSDQISAIWEDNRVTDEEANAAANQLRDYAKSQNYVLPTKTPSHLAGQKYKDELEGRKTYRNR
jgi:hypothetical protein